MNRQVRVAMTGAVLLGVLGCFDDTQSPTEPAATDPEANVVAAATGRLEFWQLSAGSDATCGVTIQGQAWCWGDNAHGQTGIGYTGTLPPKPRPVLGGLYFKQVSAGFWHTCGVSTDYRAYCWGWNAWGELGNGTGFHNTAPEAVVGGLRFYQVDAGSYHTCGISYPDRRAYCWGDNFDGQLGDGTVTRRLSPVPIQGGLQFRQLSAGHLHTCGVTTANRAYCWGSNRYGELGDSSTVYYRRLIPVPVAGAHQFRQVDAGGLHSCGVRIDNRAFCWGNGGQGQLGTGRYGRMYWPQPVAGGLYFTRVTAGDRYTCGEATTNRAYCWGYNYSGQLGNGTTAYHSRPGLVAGGFYFRQVTAGAWHTCGKTSTGLAYCWGNNARGQLGDGTTTNRLTPTAVIAP